MDTVKDQIEVVAAMKGAAAALKTEVKKINLDSVEVFCGCYFCFFASIRFFYIKTRTLQGHNG